MYISISIDTMTFNNNIADYTLHAALPITHGTPHMTQYALRTSDYTPCTNVASPPLPMPLPHYTQMRIRYALHSTY